ncbi:MAG TPA: STAS domain-containing protein [Rhodocyclaceae bacterium]|nr:STAS domain-containing protein [Rhodocyclaceae bacterium]
MVRVEAGNAEIRIHVSGEFDFQTARAMLVAARERLAKTPGHRVVIRLTEVTRIESSGVGALIILAEQVASGFTVETADCAPEVERFFASGLMERYYPAARRLGPEVLNPVT